jgi:hypothetical protein
MLPVACWTERLVAALAVFCVAAADPAVALCTAGIGRMDTLRHLAGRCFKACDWNDLIMSDVHDLRSTFECKISPDARECGMSRMAVPDRFGTEAVATNVGFGSARRALTYHEDEPGA